MSQFIVPSWPGFVNTTSTSGVYIPGAGYLVDQLVAGEINLTLDDLEPVVSIDTIDWEQYSNKVSDVSASIELGSVTLTQIQFLTLSDLEPVTSLDSTSTQGQLVIEDLIPAVSLGTITVGDLLQVEDAEPVSSITQSLLSDLFAVEDAEPVVTLDTVTVIPTASVYGLHLYNIVLFNDELTAGEAARLAATSATHNYSEFTCSGNRFMPPVVDTLTTTIESKCSYVTTLSGRVAVSKPNNTKDQAVLRLTWGPMQGSEVYKVRDFIDAHGLHGTFYFTAPNGQRKLYRFSPTGTLSIIATPYKLFKVEAEIEEV
jgi:hypothetical protein